MRTFGLLLAVALMHAAIATKQDDLFKGLLNNPRGLEETINNTLECVKETLKNGDEEIGITSFAPLIVAEAQLDLKNLGIENVMGIVNLKDLQVDGIPNWLATHLKVTVTIIPIGAKIEVSMEWPQLSLASDYDIDTNILENEIKGAGKIAASLTKFSFDLNLHATLTRGVQFQSFSLRPALEEASLKLDQLTINGEEKSEAISETAKQLPTLIKENIDAIEQKISDIVKELVNNPPGGEGGSEEPSVIQKLLEKCLK